MDNLLLSFDSSPNARKRPFNLKGLDTNCNVSDQQDRKTNHYVKRDGSRTKRDFKKVERLMSPTAFEKSLSEEDFRDADLEDEDSKSDVGEECLGNELSNCKPPSPARSKYVQEMVDRFDQSNQDTKVYSKDMNSKPQKELSGVGSQLSVEHPRIRSKSETRVDDNSIKHSRSGKRGPVPMPKFSKKSHVEPSSQVTSSDGDRNQNVGTVQAKEVGHLNTSPSTGLAILSVAGTCSCSDLNQNVTPAGFKESAITTSPELNLKNANADAAAAARVRSSKENFGDNVAINTEDLDESRALEGATTDFKMTQDNATEIPAKNPLQRKPYDQKVVRVPSADALDQSDTKKIIYVNESDSSRITDVTSQNSGDHSAKRNKDGLESSKDSPNQTKDAFHWVTNEESIDASASSPKEPSADDGDDLLYEIMTDLQHKGRIISNELPYEILPRRANPKGETPQPVQDVEATSQLACSPQPPPRNNLQPGIPSPGSSPLLSPRKSSKGQIDPSQLSQIVLPSTPAPRVPNVGSTQPPLLPPKIPARVTASGSVHSPGPSAPLIVPRKLSNAQSNPPLMQRSKSRRIPAPPPSPPSIAGASSTTKSEVEPTEAPALPQRVSQHRSSVVAERVMPQPSHAKRPSVGILKAYEKKCVEVDSGNPSKNSAKSNLASSQSMSDLQKSVLKRGSTLSLHVPAPSSDNAGDGTVSPSRSEGYLQQYVDGYLPMGSQRSSSASSPFSSDDIYLEHDSALDGPPNVPPRSSVFYPSSSILRHPKDKKADCLDKLVMRDNSYLDLVPDVDYDKYSYLTLYDDSEPLYQIYHQGAVVRQVLEQSLDSDSDCDNYYSPHEYVERAKLCVNDLLSRDSGVEPLKRNQVIRGLSTLESAAKLGTGFRKLWCEMPKVRDSGLLDHMTPEERRLQESLFEILSSEASYLKSLNLLVGHFMGMLAVDIDVKGKSVLTKQDFNWLFSNAKAVRGACIKMLEALEKLWQDGCVLSPLQLCSTITDVAQEYYSVYVTYCSNANYQERKLKELNEKNPEFQYAVRRLEEFPDCRSLPLSSFLALPMQRVTRMPLLVSTMCRYLKPDDASSPDVTRCIQVLQKIVMQCNEGARKMSNLEQMNNIDRVLDFRGVRRVPLISHSRFLVKKGSLVDIVPQSTGFLKKSKRTLFFFLFNDLLIITKKKSDKQFEVLEHSPRSHIHAEPITEENLSQFLPSGIPSGCKNLFHMVLIDRGVEFNLSCDSQSEQLRWIQAVTPVERTTEEEVVYVEWDCPQVQAVMRYVSKEPDELTLEESDIVNVLRKINDGWYEGERIRDGERGWFPANCTVEIQNAHVRARNLRQQYQLMKRSVNANYAGQSVA